MLAVSAAARRRATATAPLGILGGTRLAHFLVDLADALDIFSRLGMPQEAAEARVEVARAVAGEQRALAIDEAKAADEAFFTSASAFVMPVVEIDGAPIGAGTPGMITTRLRDIYLDEMRKHAI